MTILLVEDDATMRTTLQRALTRRGLAVTAVGDGASALLHWRSHPTDLVLLDLSLPGLDGLQVLAQARGEGLDAPVLVLTARGTVGDRVLGLNAGADDYLPKPFDLDELEARLRALLRRRAPAPRDEPTPDLQAGPLRLERASGAIYLGPQLLELTPREHALLHALMSRAGHAVSKEQLFERVFPGETEVHYEAIEVVVYRLRKKLAESGVTLMTLRGLGYLLKVPA